MDEIVLVLYNVQLDLILLFPKDVDVGCRESHASDFNDGNEDAESKVDRIDDWHDFYIIEMIQHWETANPIDWIVGLSLMIFILNCKSRLLELTNIFNLK